jgi:hypothetical protein
VLAGIDMKVHKGDEVRLTTGDEFGFPAGSDTMILKEEGEPDFKPNV